MLFLNIRSVHYWSRTFPGSGKGQEGANSTFHLWMSTGLAVLSCFNTSDGKISSNIPEVSGQIACQPFYPGVNWEVDTAA